MKLEAEWTDDCQGKKDYDGDILSISTRYWPARGRWLQLDTRTPDKGLHEVNDSRIPATAHCSLLLRGKGEDSVELVDKRFEGASFEEISGQVEAWAQEQYSIAEAALREAFDCGAAK